MLCTIAINHGYLLTSDSLLDSIIRLIPTLPMHSCARNGIGTFAEKMHATLLPHLVEHVAIDLLVQTYREEAVAFAGNTSWLDRGAQLMSVRVSYQNASVTEAALIAAVKLVNDLIQTEAETLQVGTANHPSPSIMDILQDLHSIKCDQSF